MRENVKIDFEMKDEIIKYPTSNGDYVISYAKGYPVAKFVPKPGYTPKKRVPMRGKFPKREYKVENKAFPWYDRIGRWCLVNLPDSLTGETVPQQSCTRRGLILPEKVDAVTIGVYSKDLPRLLRKYPEMKKTNLEFGVQPPNGGNILKYQVVVFPNPKLKNKWSRLGLSAGVVLLKMKAVETTDSK